MTGNEQNVYNFIKWVSPRDNDTTVNWEFLRGFYFCKTSHMRSFMKIKSSQNAEITMLFTKNVNHA